MRAQANVRMIMDMVKNQLVKNPPDGVHEVLLMGKPYLVDAKNGKFSGFRLKRS